LRFTAISNFVGNLHREIAWLSAAQTAIDIGAEAIRAQRIMTAVAGRRDIEI
jgi:hypothetical protein